MKRKIFHSLLALIWICQQGGFIQAAPVTVCDRVDAFQPMLLRGVTVDPSAGVFRLAALQPDAPGKQDAAYLAEYFRIGIMVPERCFWVNLQPDEAQRILDPSLDGTAVARVFLEADVQLKRDLAAMTDPANAAGKKYWQKVYARAEELFGQQDLEIPSVTRPWIVPGEIVIAEDGNQAFVFKAMLEVRAQEDYLNSDQLQRFSDPRMQQLNVYAAGLVRELFVPRLTALVNADRRYAALRQVFSSLILAQWVKRRFPGVSFVFSGQRVETPAGSWSKMDYYRQYRDSLSKGEYHRQDAVRKGAQIVIRQYVSGGIIGVSAEAVASVPLQHINRFIAQLPEVVSLADVPVRMETSRADQEAAADQDGGDTAGGGVTAEEIEEELVARLGDRAVSRARYASSSGSYAMFIEIVQSREMGAGEFRAILGEIISLIGVQAAAECLYTDAIGLGMLVERMCHPQARTFFLRFAALVGADALRLALLRDPGSFVESLLDGASRTGEERFLAAMQEIFESEMRVAAGLVAGGDGWFEEIVQLAADDPAKAGLFRQLNARYGRPSVLGALAFDPEAFGKAFYDEDAAGLAAAVESAAEVKRRIAALTDDRSFTQSLRQAEEGDAQTLAELLEDLLRMRKLLYAQDSGLVRLDSGKPTLVVPDLHGRRSELLALLQQRGSSGSSYLEQLLQGRLQLVLLGDLVHSESSARWKDIQAARQNGDDLPLSDEVAEGLGTVAMVLLLKTRCPQSVHWLKGNHDDVRKSMGKYVSSPGGEAALVHSWLRDNLGEGFVQRYAAMEKALPVMAAGDGFVLSHSEPGIRLRLAQIEMKAYEAVQALTWSRSEGQFTSDLLEEVLGHAGGVYIAGHTPQLAGVRVFEEGQLVIVNDQRRLQSLLVDGEQVIHDQRGPLRTFSRQEGKAQRPLAVSHSFVNDYIAENLPDILYERDLDDPEIREIVWQVVQARFPQTAGYGVQAHVIPIPGLLKNTGQFAHIGLGRVYRMPVIYIDAEYANDQTVLGHELFEIARWEALRAELQLEPEQMRGWIQRNYEAARQKADAWHDQAPDLGPLFAAAGMTGRESFDDPYRGEDDVNLGAQMTLDDFRRLRHPLTDFVCFESGAVSVYAAADVPDYRDFSVSRLPGSLPKAVARIYRYGAGYGRLIVIQTRKDISVSNELALALAQIADGFRVKDDRPLPSYQQAHQRRISAMQREDAGKVFGKNRVVVNGRYYYTRQGQLLSTVLKEESLLASGNAMQRLAGGDRLNGIGFDVLASRVDRQARAIQDALRTERAEQRRISRGEMSLDDFSGPASRDGGEHEHGSEPGDLGGIDLSRLRFSAFRSGGSLPDPGEAERAIEAFFSQCPVQEAEELRDCLRERDASRAAGRVLRIYLSEERSATSSHPGLLAILRSLAVPSR